MLNRPQFIIKIISVTIIASAILGYAYLKTKDFIAGPQITILSPINGTTLSDPLVVVTGVAKNISSISLDDRPIFVDDKGNFKEKLLLYSGYNIITVKAEDRYKRRVEKKLEILLSEHTESI